MCFNSLTAVKIILDYLGLVTIFIVIIKCFCIYIFLIIINRKTGKFSYISKFHIIISCKLIVYIVMCFYQETN